MYNLSASFYEMCGRKKRPDSSRLLLGIFHTSIHSFFLLLIHLILTLLSIFHTSIHSSFLLLIHTSLYSIFHISKFILPSINSPNPYIVSFIYLYINPSISIYYMDKKDKKDKSSKLNDFIVNSKL